MQDKIVQLAQKLIKARSVATDAKDRFRVLELVKEELPEFEIVEYEEQGVGSLLVHSRRYMGQKDFRVILNAHLDVVSANAGQFEPYVKDGKLYGRGTYDMKAAAAVEILVYKELAEQVDYPMALQLVTDEEVGGFKGTKYQVDQGVRGEFIIVGEPTDLQIGHKAKGILWLELVFIGQSAHGAYLWQGKSAVWEMESFLERLKTVYPVPEVEVWKTTVNVAHVSTENVSYNKVPDNCVVKLDVRFIPEDKELVLEKLSEILPESAQMTVIMNESSQFTEMENDYLQKLKSACTEVMKQDCKVIARHGGADLRFFDAVGGKGVEFGPVGYGHHTEEEWVDVESLGRYYDILRQFLLSLNN